MDKAGRKINAIARDFNSGYGTAERLRHAVHLLGAVYEWLYVLRRRGISMRYNRKTRKVRVSTRDYSKSLSVRMTEERLQRYMGMTRLNSTAYFRRLIQENEFKGRSPKLNHALHVSVNVIYSNVKQITRHQRARGMDAEAVSKLLFLTDKLCEEVYLLSNQKWPFVRPQEASCGPPRPCWSPPPPPPKPSSPA